MRRWPWLRTAITVAACLAPAAAQCQVTAAPSRSQTRVLSLYRLVLPGRSPAPITPSVSGPTGRCWVTHWAISLNYYSELLDSYNFPDPSYRIRLRRLSRAQVWWPDDRPADRERPDRGRSCGAVTGAAPVSTADRVHRPRCAAASSQIDRPYLSACHERVARFGAAGASRIHATCSSCAAHRHGMHGTKTSFARRCPRRREAWSSPSCADTPCLR